jgi:hypothetical protein
MRRLFFVPEEHKDAFTRALRKLGDGKFLNGSVTFVTEDELEAIKSQYFVDIPDEKSSGNNELPSKVEAENGFGR